MAEHGRFYLLSRSEGLVSHSETGSKCMIEWGSSRLIWAVCGFRAWLLSEQPMDHHQLSIPTACAILAMCLMLHKTVFFFHSCPSIFQTKSIHLSGVYYNLNNSKKPILKIPNSSIMFSTSKRNFTCIHSTIQETF